MAECTCTLFICAPAYIFSCNQHLYGSLCWSTEMCACVCSYCEFAPVSTVPTEKRKGVFSQSAPALLVELFRKAQVSSSGLPSVVSTFLLEWNSTWTLSLRGHHGTPINPSLCNVFYDGTLPGSCGIIWLNTLIKEYAEYKYSAVGISLWWRQISPNLER